MKTIYIFIILILIFTAFTYTSKAPNINKYSKNEINLFNNKIEKWKINK